MDQDVPACPAAMAVLAIPGRGLLALDESLGMIGKRLTPLGTEATLDTRVAERGKASPFQGDRRCWSN